MKFNIGFIPTLLLLIPVIFACFKTPADKPELEDENIIVFIAKCGQIWLHRLYVP